MRRLLFLSCLFLIVACKSTKQVVSIPEEECKSITIVKELATADPATIVIDTLYIHSGELHTRLRVKGCNQAANILLAWNGAMMKSYPPRVSLKLLADKAGDLAVMSAFQPCFSLIALQQGEGSGKVYIGIEGSEQKLLYEY